MNTVKSQSLLGVLGLVFIFSLFSCNSGKKSSDDVDSSSTGTGVGVVQETAFFVNVTDTGKFPFFMSKLGEFGTPCEIATGTIGTHLDCVVDVNELDLYFNGLTLSYNYPSEMCAYSSSVPYWFYNFEVGKGPTQVDVEVSQAADGTITGTRCSVDGAPLSNSCSFTEASYSTLSNSWTCVYDHTATTDYPNCCVGDYTRNLTTITAGGPTTYSSEPASWGSNYADCIGGPGKADWTFFSRDGRPRRKIEYVEGKGLNDTLKVSSPISVANEGYTVPIANYYLNTAGTASNHQHTGYVSTDSSPYPYMIRPIDDRNGSAISGGQPAYSWECLDKDHEVINSISVYVRDWNTYAEFVKYGTSQGASGNPDINGTEGGGGANDCDYGSGLSDSPWCDDFGDLEYFIGPYIVTDRDKYFPQILYGK